MAARLAVLTVAGLLAASSAGASPAATTPVNAAANQAATAPPVCLRCHAPHHEAEGRCVDCHRGDPATARPDLAHGGLVAGAYASFGLPVSPRARRGAALIDLLACRRCHRVAGTGRPRASDLDVRARTTLPKALNEALARPAAAMPVYPFNPRQRVDVVVALLRAARDTPAPARTPPRRVYFVEDEARLPAFTRRCGRCHRVLSDAAGSLGTGDVGPNLSGLLGPFARPARSTRTGERWTPTLLDRWLRNPRAVRPYAVMAPVPLDDAERRSILHVLGADR